MEGRIAHLRSHFRVVSAPVAAPGMAARLDKVLHERLTTSYEEALGKAFAGDDAVYVVRRVEAKTTLLVTPETPDGWIATRWAKHLAGAVVRTIAGDANAANVVRFENQADYIAQYLIAHLNGDACDLWFFDAFDELSQPGNGHSINQALLDNVEYLPAVLAYVFRSGELDSLLASLDTETKRALWPIETKPRTDRETIRLFFSEAFRLVDEINCWMRRRPEADDLLEDYLDSAPLSVDWRDARALADSVFKVLRFLFARGYLRQSEEEDKGQYLALVKQALAGIYWLDREWLESSLIELLVTNEKRTAELPSRRLTNPATPRQRELLSTLAKLVREELREFGNSDLTTDALRLFALLVGRAPRWADDAASKVMIQHLLSVRAALHPATSPATFA